MTKKNQTFMIKILHTLPSYLVNDFNETLKDTELMDGAINNNLIDEIRKAKISWVKDCKFLKRIYKDVVDYNKILYNFDLVGWGGNQCQFTVYEKDSHYDWHVDLSMDNLGLVTKLTTVTALNDTDDYEGGKLLIKDFNGQIHEFILNKGETIIFPSMLFHKVTPITKGVRKSLVGWVVGPPFK